MRAALRRSLAILTVCGLGLGLSALNSPSALAAATCTTTVTASYTVQVCITAPDAGAALTGDTTVSATQTVIQGSASVSRMIFAVDNQYLLSAFTAPYTFTWHTARHWVDGPHNLRAYARMSDGSDTSANAATETVTLANGVTTTPVNSNSPTITTGTVPAAGQPEIIGAVGSGADGRGANQVAAEVAGWSPNLFLYLGDVYEQGSYEEFDNWYDPSWGPMRSVTNPVPGDQEAYYGVQGYNWYWNNEPAYYSYDVAGWHFIALTQCAWSSNSFPPSGLCSGSSPEVTWLNNDLAAHPGACTIAYWHEPRFALDGSGGSAAEQPLWAPLANSHATMAVNADRHNYERWTAMDA
ncbi:MAG TPA: Ig-like domain-containing protein, partial [Candidatus Dormibacteraeota bacterium]|nr:Ig-like domain-containing protein [Candidatus Dormibacteraeota bacterium]